MTAMPMHLEHIVPLAAGGTSDEENLWLACPLCNGSKGSRVQATDPETGNKTLCGRATVIALKLNNENLTRARRRWVLADWHPLEP
jgi:5-methylcytosine-specific restriction endonuclease McrA